MCNNPLISRHQFCTRRCVKRAVRGSSKSFYLRVDKLSCLLRNYTQINPPKKQNSDVPVFHTACIYWSVWELRLCEKYEKRIKTPHEDATRFVHTRRSLRTLIFLDCRMHRKFLEGKMSKSATKEAGLKTTANSDCETALCLHCLVLRVASSPTWKKKSSTHSCTHLKLYKSVRIYEKSYTWHFS